MAQRKKNPSIRKRLAKPKDINLTELPKLKKWIAEPKLDGLRGIIILNLEKRKCNAYTSSGVKVPSAKYICRDIQKRVHSMSVVIDGEFFSKDWNLTQSLVMTQKKHPEAKKLLAIRCFDAMPYNDWIMRKTVPLKARKKFLSVILKRIASLRVIGVPFEYVLNKPKPLQKFFKRMRDEKYEGAMFKDPDAAYPFKRDKVWLRLKQKQTIDCRVIGVKPGKGKYEGLLGSLLCEFKHVGKKIQFNAAGMTDAQRKKFTQMHKRKKLLGSVFEFEHEGLTVNNRVRFPQFKRIRKDKE